MRDLGNYSTAGPVLVAKEPHSEGGYHLNAGVFNRNASKHTTTKKIRECFTEWEGRALDVQFHPGLPYGCISSKKIRSCLGGIHRRRNN